MGRRNRKGRDITGIIVVDKPGGASSNHVLQRVKRLFNAKKAGHTGALDPLATGVLPICLGEATKVSSYLLDADKSYHVTCRLGITTDSGDADGKTVALTPVPDFNARTLQALLPRFLGVQQQLPPMYSALKHQGQPLYKLARQGLEVERKARSITIYDLRLLDCARDSFSLEVSCSKGTYIRTLVEDISHALGCGGHVIALRRIKAAGYDIDQAVSLPHLQALAEADFSALDQQLLPAADALPDWPEIRVSAQEAIALRHGQRIRTQQPFEHENVRLFSPQQEFLGLGKMTPDRYIQPKRIFVSHQDQECADLY